MRKFLVSVLMVVALFAMSGLAMAQTDVVCGTLSAADCEIITQSAAAQSSLTSASFDFNLNITSSGQAIPLTGDGSYVIDPAVVAGFDAAAFANTSDPAAVFEALGKVLGGFQGELNLSVMGAINLNLVLVNGTGYFNFASVAPLLGGAEALGAMGLPAGWAGLDLVGAIDMFAPMLSNPEIAAATGEVDPAAQQAIVDAVAANSTITREADENGLAVFVTSVDFGALLQNEAFLSLILEQAAAGQDLGEAEIAQFQQMLASVGQGFNFSATQKIDLSSYYLTSLSFEFNIDGDAIAAISGEQMEDIVIAGAVNFADFNSAAAISAPAGAPIATVMDLMGLMGGMGGF